MRPSIYITRSLVIGFGIAFGFNAAGVAATITITSWGGSYAHAQLKSYHEPFTAATGVRVVQDEWGGDLARIGAMVARNFYTANLIDAEGDDVAIGCENGYLEPIDYTRLTIKEQDLIEGATHRCGVATIAWSMVLAYDRQQLSGQQSPDGWQDFWDTRRFPGKRGLRKSAQGTLELTLMADGVPIVEIYEALRSPTGVERALRKLDVIWDDIVWWEFGSQAPRLLLDASVVMAATWNGRWRRRGCSAMIFACATAWPRSTTTSARSASRTCESWNGRFPRTAFARRYATTSY